VAEILADTNELQTDLVNGGRLDLLIDAIKTAAEAAQTQATEANAHAHTVDGHITADYGTTEKSAIDLLDDVAGGLADIHTDVGTAITNIGDVHSIDLPAVKADTAAILVALANVQGDVNIISGGYGSKMKTITVQSPAGTPVDGVCVWVTTDAGGTNIAALGYTDAFGVVTFMLDVGTYYCWKQHSDHDFTNPETLVVT
jgi:hypothetical protein